MVEPGSGGVTGTTSSVTSARAHPQAAKPRASVGSVLKNPPFLRLWLAQAISQTATNMVNFALLLRVRNIIEVHDIQQANTAISLVILAFSLPSVLFGPLAGVMADRMNRRLLMAATNALRAVAVLCFLVINPEWHVETILVATYLVTFLFGIAGQFFAPAQGATIPALVPRAQLISANALFNLTFTAAQLLGFATVGPVLIKLIGINELFVLTVVLFIVCTVLVMTLPPTPPPPRNAATAETRPMTRLWSDIKEGMVFILQDPYLMKAIAYLVTAATTFLMVAALGPQFVTGVIGLPKEDIGYIVAPAGFGVLFGVLVVGQVVKRYSREAVIDWALALAGVTLGLVAIGKDTLDFFWTGGSSPLWLSTTVTAFFAMLLGICNAFILVPAQTMLQERSHEHIRARVYATFFTISNTVAFVPIFFAAASADLFGVVQVLVIVALIVAAVGFSSVIRRRSAESARWARPRTRHRQGPEAILPPAKKG
ncbi:MAG TPA: MFS transporter [Thermomicrobiales bacterium]|nr:MFS transporter [Thermomicrobiales bacterium]